MKRFDKLFADVTRTDRDEIESIITQVEANGAKISAEDVRMLIAMTSEARHKFLQI